MAQKVRAQLEGRGETMLSQCWWREGAGHGQDGLAHCHALPRWDSRGFHTALVSEVYAWTGGGWNGEKTNATILLLFQFQITASHRGGPRSRGGVKEVETPAACTDHRARLSAERADSQLRAARSLLSVTPLTPTLGRWEGWKWWGVPS